MSSACSRGCDSAEMFKGLKIAGDPSFSKHLNKYNTALDQIRERRYFAGLDRYEGNTLLIGVSYDKHAKKHLCVIEMA